MKKNIGTLDRLIRAALAALFFSFAWWWSSLIFFGLGAFSLYEAIAGWCIMYQILGKNSCPTE